MKTNPNADVQKRMWNGGFVPRVAATCLVCLLTASRSAEVQNASLWSCWAIKFKCSPSARCCPGCSGDCSSMCWPNYTRRVGCGCSAIWQSWRTLIASCASRTAAQNQPGRLCQTTLWRARFRDGLSRSILSYCGDLSPPPSQYRCGHHGLLPATLPHKKERPDEGHAANHG